MLGLFRVFTWVIHKKWEQGVILQPYAFTPGVTTFFFLIWSFGLHSDLQIKALDSPRASRGCSLAHGHSSLLVSSPLLTLSLEFLDHISFWPDHSVILTMCRLCLLPRPLLTGENDHRRGKQVMGGSCSPLHPPGAPDISPSVGGLT